MKSNFNINTPHIPVLPNEAISSLLTDPNGVYLDGTVGYGGHALQLLKNLLPKGKLIGMDLDPYALKYTQKILSSARNSYSLHHGNFREYPNLLQKLGIKKLTGILIDLGSSSSQIDNGHRGFSFQRKAPLDMRFNPQQKHTAKDILNNLDEKNISKIIKNFGEERNHRSIASNIYKYARLGRMNTTYDLRDAIVKSVNKKFLTKSLARVFQSIRIKVNDEINSLTIVLKNSSEWLDCGGRIAIISFHSIEDRIVKHFFIDKSKVCICPREYPICKCNIVPDYKIVNKKAIVPTVFEIKNNPRSRSAKLRVAQRV